MHHAPENLNNSAQYHTADWGNESAKNNRAPTGEKLVRDIHTFENNLKLIWGLIILNCIKDTYWYTESIYFALLELNNDTIWQLSASELRCKMGNWDLHVPDHEIHPHPYKIPTGKLKLRCKEKNVGSYCFLQTADLFIVVRLCNILTFL